MFILKQHPYGKEKVCSEMKFTTLDELKAELELIFFNPNLVYMTFLEIKKFVNKYGYDVVEVG